MSDDSGSWAELSKIEDSLSESLVDDSKPSSDPHGGGASSNTSNSRTMINFLKSFIGSGLLGLPYAFYKGGLLFSMVSVIILGLVSNYCIRMLLACAEELEPKYGRVTFGEMGKYIFGRNGQIVVELCLIIAQLGFCCVYVIFMSTNLEGIFGQPSWLFVIILLPGLVLMSWLRSFKWLAILSLIGQATGFFGYFSIMGFALISTVKNTPSVAPFNWAETPIFFGMAVFAFEGVGLVIPMRRAMKTPKAYPIVLDSGFICIIVLSLAFGTICYTGYGDQLSPNSVAQNLPQDRLFTPIIQLLLVTSIFCSYPVQLFPITSIIEHILFTKVTLFARQQGMTREHIKNGFRTLLVVITSIVAITIPYFSLFVSLIGAVGCSGLMFIIPCVFHLKLFYGKSPKIIMITNILIVFFGVAAGCISAGLTSWTLIQVMFLSKDL